MAETASWKLLPHRPAAAAAVLLGMGILAHDLLTHRPAIWLAALTLTTLAALALHRRARISSILIAASLFLCGVALAQATNFQFPHDHVGGYAGADPRLAEIELRVVQPPRVLARSVDQHSPLPPKQVMTGVVERIRTWSGWSGASGLLLVRLDQPHPRLRVGQRLRVMGMLQRPGPAMNPGQFDWAEYYREQRIVAAITVSHAAAVQVLSTEGPSLLEQLRQRTRQVLAMGFGPDRALDHALLRALLLGDADPQLSDVKDDFRRTGTGHHLAISGLHVAVLGMVVFSVCRVLCLRPRASAWVGMGFVVLYGLVALPSPPVVRSVLLCLGFGLGLVSRRALEPIQLLGLSVLLMLIYHPLDLYNAGFQLSFGTVLGLMIFTRPAVEFLNSFRDPDVVIAERAQPLVGLRATWTRMRQSCIGVAAAGGVAWAVSAPLVAYHFEQLNPWAIAASILLAPVVFAALVGGMLKVMLTLLWPGAAPLWAELAAGPVALMRHGADWLAMLPGSDVPLSAPPLWMILAWYLLLCLPLLRLVWMGRIARFVPITQCGVALFGIPLIGLLPPADVGPLRVTVLAVGAGSCAVVELPDGATALIDAGSSSLPDLQQSCLGPFLRHRGRRSVEALLISHANVDHLSAAGEVVEAYGVGQVGISPYFRDHARGNSPVEDLLQRLGRSSVPTAALQRGDRLDWGAGVDVEVLWPRPGLPLTVNDSSLVVRLRFGGRSILFTGDVQEEGLRYLLESPDMLRCDVLLAPHHGSAEPATGAFITAASPQAIISSNDRTLSKKQRDLEPLTRGRRLLRTDRSGAVTVTIWPDGAMEVTPWREEVTAKR